MTTKSQMKMIPYEHIERDPSFNSRENGNSINELAESLKVHGLLQPLGVTAKTKLETDGSQHYFLIYGDRRYQAIGIIRETMDSAFGEVPVFIKEGTFQSLKEINLIENIDREELKPHEVSKAIVEMVNTGMEQRDIAKRLGRPQSWVSYHHKVATKLGPDASTAFKEGDLTFEQALLVAEVPEEDQAPLVENIKTAGSKAAARKIAKEGASKAGTKRTYSNKNRPSVKNLVRSVQDASFDGLSKIPKDQQSFYNGVAAGIRVALGTTKMDDAKPGTNFLDTQFTTTPGLAPAKAKKKAATKAGTKAAK